MELAKIEKLQAMIQNADFLNAETKTVFLNKIPYLSAKKFEDLYEIFANNWEEKEKINLQKKEVFLKYKQTLTEIYQKGKQKILQIKEKAFGRADEASLHDLDSQLSEL